MEVREIEIINEVGVRPVKNRQLVLTIIGIVVGLLFGLWLGLRLDAGSSALDYSELDEVYAALKDNYDGEIKDEDLINGAKRGMVDGLGDPYTQLFTEVEAQEFQESLEGEFQGIGIEFTNRNGALTIIDTLDDTPAEKAGLMAGDLIAKVDDKDTLSWLADDATKIIRGPAGTKVKMTIIRDNKLLEFDIERATINSPSVKYEIKDGVGVLKISRFAGGDTVDLAEKAARKFVEKKVKGVVLDLRGNGGGYVSAAADVASLWIDSGKIVTTEKTGSRIVTQEKARGSNILKGLKTVVLIDGGSASASEILAGALKDYKLATVVGVDSFGKGSVQTIKSLPSSGDRLKVTIARWYTPNDKNITESGIAPDEKVELNVEAYRKDGSDNQLKKALEIAKRPKK
ncbi:MAG: S41 family peptidase [Candidatus Nomurabacteria bacterium]|jgi:carboxyl-terminal processing protease|nr:S41 family peptidase [Candidatus Nomurabacteria bacterium]